MTKLITGYITQNDSDWLIMSLEAVEAISDKIIIVDGGSDQRHLDKLDAFINGNEKYLIVHNKYPGNNGLQYQVLLDEAFKHKTDENTWLLVLDSDEVIDDNSHFIREYLDKSPNVFNIRMEHAIYDLAHFDATNGGAGYNPQYQHYVLSRLYKLKDGIYYKNSEHGMITGFTEAEYGLINDVVIWHYGKAKGMYDLKKKFDMNIARSDIHSREFLTAWYTSHLIGKYPTKELSYLCVQPSVIRREFYLDSIQEDLNKTAASNKDVKLNG